ncbi:MAG: GvpL/GvpF family gas vesicle protein [Gemmatimonadota bacterium]
MLHGYCVRRAGEPSAPPDLAGVGGSSVRVVEAEGLGIWVSETDGAAVNLERLRDHERVVRAALRSATPLPLRFGAVFAEEDAAVRLLTDRGEEFGADLERIANRVEMGLRIGRAGDGEQEGRGDGAPSPDGEGGDRERPGRAYLEARRAALRTAAAAREASASVLDQVESRFADLELPSVRSIEGTTSTIGRVAHLVHREQLRLYRDRIELLQLDRGDLRITVTGPWAPYSFV